MLVLYFLDCFCAVTATDIQKKIALGTGKKRKVPPEERLSVEKVADRFNQVTWHSFIWCSYSSYSFCFISQASHWLTRF